MSLPPHLSIRHTPPPPPSPPHSHPHPFSLTYPLEGRVARHFLRVRQQILDAALLELRAAQALGGSEELAAGLGVEQGGAAGGGLAERLFEMGGGGGWVYGGKGAKGVSLVASLYVSPV